MSSIQLLETHLCFFIAFFCVHLWMFTPERRINFLFLNNLSSFAETFTSPLPGVRCGSPAWAWAPPCPQFPAAAKLSAPAVKTSAAACGGRCSTSSWTDRRAAWSAERYRPNVSPQSEHCFFPTVSHVYNYHGNCFGESVQASVKSQTSPRRLEGLSPAWYQGGALCDITKGTFFFQFVLKLLSKIS